MELFATRGYFFCRYCGSFDFPETASGQGLRVLAELPDAPECPACGRKLATALLDEAHPVHCCQNCRGVLMPRGTFADVVRLRRAFASGPPSAPMPLRGEDLERLVRCPTCRNSLTAHPYYGPGNVVIDSCERCDVIWLDFGELQQIVNAPGRDRGGREQSALKDEEWSAGGPAGGRVIADFSDGESSRPHVDLLGALFNLLSR